MTDQIGASAPGHRSVPPVVTSLAVDPSTAASIAETFVAPGSTGRRRAWLGPVIALLVAGLLIVASVLLWSQGVGFDPVVGTPAPSF
jgi:hypothetical protein